MTATQQMADWMERCEQAARTHDSEKLVKLLFEINAVLDTKYARRAAKYVASGPAQLPN